MKFVYIAHPISGNVEENVRRILALCKEVHLAGHIPCVPYLTSLSYLNDALVEERTLGIQVNEAYFKRRIMNEVWVYGSHISEGVRGEIMLAVAHGIPVVCKSPALMSDVRALITTLTTT